MLSKSQAMKSHSGYKESSKDVFSGIGCLDGIFSLQIKLDSKPYHTPPRNVAYAPKQPFKKRLEHLQQQDIIPALGIDETAKWCNSFLLVPELNGKVRLHLYPGSLTQLLIRLVCREPALNDKFPKINNV